MNLPASRAHAKIEKAYALRLIINAVVYLAIGSALLYLFELGTRLPFQIFFCVSAVYFLVRLGKYAWYNYYDYVD